MYDKVTFWISRQMVGDATFEGLRFFMKEGANVGYMGNIRIEYIVNREEPTAPPQSARCSGSIPKWFTSSNIVAPTFGEAVEQIDQLCGVLHIIPDQVRVTGVEFGSSFEVNQPPERYIELMWSYPKSVRKSLNKSRDVKTVYFESDAKRPTFCHTLYDKGAEVLKKEGVSLKTHTLRYEIRYHRSLKAQLKWKASEIITLSTLQDPDFFNLLKDRYIEVYNRITKLTEMKGGTKVTTGGQGANLFFAQLANEYLRQDPDALKRFIEEMKRQNPNLPAQTIMRMRSKIREVLKSTNQNTGRCGLLSELEERIQAECKRCAPK